MATCSNILRWKDFMGRGDGQGTIHMESKSLTGLKIEHMRPSQIL